MVPASDYCAPVALAIARAMLEGWQRVPAQACEDAGQTAGKATPPAGAPATPSLSGDVSKEYVKSVAAGQIQLASGSGG